MPYPELVRIHQAAAAGDWVGVRSAYLDQQTEPLRTAAVRTVGEVKDSKSMLTPVAEASEGLTRKTACRTYTPKSASNAR
jgi:hypothetical protein